MVNVSWKMVLLFHHLLHCCLAFNKTYRIEVKTISSEVDNLCVDAKVSFAGSLRNVNQILVVSSLLHSRTDCLSIYIIIAN